MPTFFRHRESQRATTRNVQGGREHGPAGETNEKTKTGNTDKQSNKEKDKSNGKKNRGRPAQKLQTTRGMSLRTDDVLEKKTANTEPEKKQNRATQTIADPKHLQKM